MPKKRKKKTSEELSNENELMKLKMMAEFGGDFMGSDDIPPDVENQFLKQIINFHKHHDKTKVTNVYKFIGEPEYNHVNDLSDKEIPKELKILMKLMEKNGVALSALAETPKREVYRFITEELFKQEIEDVKLKGWIHQFVYEEFYPNAEYDTRNAAFLCIESVFNKDFPLHIEYFSEEMKDAIGLSMEPEEFIAEVKHFKEEYFGLKLDSYDLPEVRIYNDVGVANILAHVTYKTQADKGKRFKTETAKMQINLEKSPYMDSWWEVKQVISDAW